MSDLEWYPAELVDESCPPAKRSPAEFVFFDGEIAILEALIPTGSKGPDGTREILRKRYRESAELVRQHSPNPQR